MSAEPDPPDPRLPLPPDGSACGGGCAIAFVGFFVVLAVDNLLNPAGAPVFAVCGTVASVLWLALVVAFLRAAGCNLEPTESETEFRHCRE